MDQNAEIQAPKNTFAGLLARMQQRTPRTYKYKMSRSTVDSSPSKVTVKTAEHDTVMGALKSAQDVIEGIPNATQALLMSLTYPVSSTQQKYNYET